MKRAPLLITIAVIAAVGIIIYLVSDKSDKKTTGPWDLVPESSVAVLETADFSLVHQIKLDSTGLIEFLIQSKPGLASDQPMLCVFQAVGKRMEFMALIPAATGANFSSWVEEYRKRANAKIKERTYERIKILDLSGENSTQISASTVENIWVVATSPLLVEEVIRGHRSDERLPFQTKHSQLFRLSTIKKDDGNLYVNWSRIADQQDSGVSGFSRWLCHSMLFDLRWSEGSLLMNGFAVDTTQGNSSVLSLFRDQRPVAFDLKDIIPVNYQMMVHMALSDPLAWSASRQRFCALNQPRIPDSLSALEVKYGFRLEELVKGIDNEIALCHFPKGEEMIFVELKEITKATAELGKLHGGLAKEGGYEQERYSNQVIHLLRKEDLLFNLFWPLGSRSAETFYAILGQHLLLSNSETRIKRAIDLIELENTLGKSLKWRKFFESGLQESSLSFYLNMDQWNLFQGPGLLSSFGKIEGLSDVSMQFYSLERNYYANAVFQFRSALLTPGASAKTAREFKLNGPYIRELWLTKNHTNRATEILIQDSTNQLMLLSPAGIALWNKKLEGPVNSEMHQIDFLKNGKLQYAFTTPGQLHIVDRLGRDLDGYPRRIQIDDVPYLSVVDYDKNKDYRFLVARSGAEVVIYDKNGKALEGWRPKVLDRKIISPPRHFRIRQRDYYLVVTDSRDFFLFNRRGDRIKGFPVKLDFRPAGECVSEGSSIVAVAPDGRMIRVNTQGRIVHEESLLKNTKESKFELIRSQGGNDFVISRLERGNVGIFDSSGKMLFDIANPASDKVAIDLYYYSEDRAVLLITDLDQDLFYAVDLKGHLLTPEPVPTLGKPRLEWQSGNELSLVVPMGTSLKRISVPL